jgi:hypothetical protein
MRTSLLKNWAVALNAEETAFTQQNSAPSLLGATSTIRERAKESLYYKYLQLVIIGRSVPALQQIIVQSLLITAKLHGIDPYTYLDRCPSERKYAFC